MSRFFPLLNEIVVLHWYYGIGHKMDALNLLAKQIIHKKQYQEENLIKRIVEGIF